MKRELSALLHIVHTIVIVGNLTGWMFQRTRRAHLALVSLTLFSWIVLGYFYGFGYCFLTDWHWQILEARGHTGLPASYVAYVIENLTGWNPDPAVVDAGTGISFGLAVIASLFANRDLFQRQHIQGKR